MLETTHFTDIDDISASELDRVLTRAADLKSGADETRLSRATLAMLFEKPSTRTRVSFETGMTQLGGHALFLGPEDIQLGHGEPLSDTARVLGRYGDAIMVRLFEHADLLEIAEHSDAPVINGLTDDAHPCQTLADLLTIQEHVGPFDEVQAAWVGDGNNVGQSFVKGCAMAGVDLTVATPEGYAMDDEVIAQAAELGQAPTVTTDPHEAIDGADVVYTDVWISMGQESQRHEKLQAFEGFQLNESLLEGSDAKVMHCLPAHRGEEITGDVLEGDRSIVWDQAENRLHAQKGLIVELLEN
ncbi:MULTISPECIES: ornithine carbamoyltransferase [Haloferax]|uniref:Ornithine carbamoyltransferase n=1 Tax=Haloferax marinum TaxID=2666143 RepID=A0A6A8G9D3_9EURY|nr:MULTISPECIES: ornithine carbamoyltransferase [Haloferax]KAB1197673.1 ornithine carbamoyltransferase [Haloferax sp. CBA1150]MRW96726.1 ornithine carbamoyltransferase [Haloferax marinum]